VCLSTKNERVEADVRDLGRGGLFIRSVRPLSVGQRLSIDIFVGDEKVPWSVLGRVVWTRDASEEEPRPAGMGIKLIVEDAPISAAIERLVDAHERKERASRPAAPAREMTVLGVGPSDEPSAIAAAPVIAVAPGREPTILGVGSAVETPAREVSVPIELVSRKPYAMPPVNAREMAGVIEESQPPRAKERRGRGGLVVVMLLAVAAAGAYALRDRLRMEWREWGPGQVTTPGAAATSRATPPPTAEIPTAIAVPPPIATPTITASGAPSVSPSKRAPSGVTSAAPMHGPDAKTEENPY
jgi:Tfp pilus assembly protein PilZ